MKPYEILPVVSVMRATGKPIEYYPNFGKFLNSATAALFLSHFMYWEGKQKDEERWIYKKRTEIEKETGLTRWEIESARKILKGLEILEEKKEGAPALLHYRFDWVKFEELFSEYASKLDLPKEKKKREPKKETPTEEQKVNILGLMKDVFDKYFILAYPQGYEWSKDTAGKDWGSMKDLKIKLENRVRFKKLSDLKKTEPLTEKKESDFEFTDEEIVSTFDWILKLLPEYHVKINFTPALLNSNFNKILIDVINGYSKEPGNNNNKNERASKESASEWV